MSGGPQKPVDGTDHGGGQEQALLRPAPAGHVGPLAFEKAEEGGGAVGPGVARVPGHGRQGGGIADELGGQRVAEEGEEQLVRGGAAQGLVDDAVGETEHVARHAPTQHRLDLNRQNNLSVNYYSFRVGGQVNFRGGQTKLLCFIHVWFGHFPKLVRSSKLISST